MRGTPAAPRRDDITDERLLRFAADLGAAPGDTLAAPGSLWHRTVLPVLRDDLLLAGALRTAALAEEARGTPSRYPSWPSTAGTTPSSARRPWTAGRAGPTDGSSGAPSPATTSSSAARTHPD
ncbi:hypothetical protein HFP71_00315 [Streptomyces sp. ARC32]